jgi:hypothetical protein
MVPVVPLIQLIQVVAPPRPPRIQVFLPVVPVQVPVVCFLVLPTLCVLKHFPVVSGYPRRGDHDDPSCMGRACVMNGGSVLFLQLPLLSLEPLRRAISCNSK